VPPKLEGWLKNNKVLVKCQNGGAKTLSNALIAELLSRPVNTIVTIPIVIDYSRRESQNSKMLPRIKVALSDQYRLPNRPEAFILRLIEQGLLVLIYCPIDNDSDPVIIGLITILEPLPIKRLVLIAGPRVDDVRGFETQTYLIAHTYSE